MTESGVDSRRESSSWCPWCSRTRNHSSRIRSHAVVMLALDVSLTSSFREVAAPFEGLVRDELAPRYRGGPPHQGCSGQAKSTPKTSTHNFAIKACQESQRSLQRPTPPPPPARMRRTSCAAGLPECLCLQQPPRRHALLRHRHLDLGFKVSRDSKTL